MTTYPLLRRNQATATRIEEIMGISGLWTDIALNMTLDDPPTVTVTWAVTSEQLVALAQLAAEAEIRGTQP